VRNTSRGRSMSLTCGIGYTTPGNSRQQYGATGFRPFGLSHETRRRKARQADDWPRQTILQVHTSPVRRMGTEPDLDSPCPPVAILGIRVSPSHNTLAANRHDLARGLVGQQARRMSPPVFTQDLTQVFCGPHHIHRWATHQLHRYRRRPHRSRRPRPRSHHCPPVGKSKQQANGTGLGRAATTTDPTPSKVGAPHPPAQTEPLPRQAQGLQSCRGRQRTQRPCPLALAPPYHDRWLSISSLCEPLQRLHGIAEPRRNVQITEKDRPAARRHLRYGRPPSHSRTHLFITEKGYISLGPQSVKKRGTGLLCEAEERCRTFWGVPQLRRRGSPRMTCLQAIATLKGLCRANFWRG